MRINWLAPLPPAKTGIAFYCRDLLPHLTRLADVRCWTPQKVWDRDIEEWVRVATLENDDAFWRELNRADLTICHLGNNPFAFGEIQEIASRHPSLVVLHKAQLFELFLGIACEIHHDPASFADQLRRVYGSHAERALLGLRAGSLRVGELAARFPFTQTAIEGALGVFCHHPRAVEVVRAGGWVGPLAWHELPAAGQAVPRPPKEPGPPRKLIAFGHFPKDHLLGPLLDALAAYPRRDLLHLDVFGELPDFPAMAERRDRLALHGQVLFHGFVIEPMLLATLGKADLNVDLRRPGTTASAVRLQSWRYGVPCLELDPDDERGEPATRAIREASLGADLHRAWDDLLDAPERYAPLVERASRRLATRHDPEAYLESLLAFAEVCRGGLEAAAWGRLEKRAAAFQAGWPPLRG